MTLTPHGNERRVRRMWDEKDETGISDDDRLRTILAEDPTRSVQKIGVELDRAHGSVNNRIHKLGLRDPIIRQKPTEALPPTPLSKIRDDIIVKYFYDPWQSRLIPISLPRLHCLENTSG